MICHACDKPIDPEKDEYHSIPYEIKGVISIEIECNSCYWGGTLDDVEEFVDRIVDTWPEFFSNEVSEEERDLEVMKKMAEVAKELNDRVQDYFEEKIRPFMDARIAKMAQRLAASPSSN